VHLEHSNGQTAKDTIIAITPGQDSVVIEMAVRLGRKTRHELKIGICGEHGGEPSSVKFCDRMGMNYVSCSPFRVPIARLAAAQAALEEAGVVSRTKATV